MPKVNRFRDVRDAVHYPGDIVDLPMNYEGETWLMRVDPLPEVKAPEAKLTPVKTDAAAVPLEAPKKTPKKSKS